jgi:hypothetical protein
MDISPEKYVQATHATFEDFMECVCRWVAAVVAPWPHSAPRVGVACGFRACAGQVSAKPPSHALLLRELMCAACWFGVAACYPHLSCPFRCRCLPPPLQLPPRRVFVVCVCVGVPLAGVCVAPRYAKCRRCSRVVRAAACCCRLADTKCLPETGVDVVEWYRITSDRDRGPCSLFPELLC